MFIVEDTNNNKFGGYITATINQYGTWISNSNPFVFSLKSKGRLNGMMKFKSQSSSVSNGFYLQLKNSNYLFIIGGGQDIRVEKKGVSGNSCSQRDFNYEGISNALCGGGNFTPKRITVIQMR